jgi:hypothetical protein
MRSWFSTVRSESDEHFESAGNAPVTGPVQLASHEVHWWRVGLDVPLEACADLYAMLTRDERDRSGCLRFECDQRRFIVAHGLQTVPQLSLSSVQTGSRQPERILS